MKINEYQKFFSANYIVENGQKISKSCLTLMDALSKPKLKIALITYYFEKPSHNGTAIHAQNLAKYLSEHNCEVHVFCTGKEDLQYKEGNVIVHTIGKIFTSTSTNISKTRLEYDLFESEVVKSIIRENTKKKFDIIHTHGELVKAAFILKKVYGIKWIHTFHAIERLRIKQLSVEEKEFGDLISWIESTTNYCDGAIFVSKDLLKEGKKYYTLKSIRVIPNGVDLSLFNYTPITKKNVLFIGRFSKDKGIHYMPQLINEVMNIPNTTFTICAPYETPTPELKAIEKIIQNQKEVFGERLTLILQAQKQEVIRQLYKNCQVYIQPSKYESFGLCIVEAMATGRPVVAFRVGGIPEVIGEAGFTVKNIKEFVAKIKELLNNKSTCISVGEKASIRAKTFDWDLITQKTIKYYKEVLK
jgi:glycosyltransferase involved in cell wall biosynthesis